MRLVFLAMSMLTVVAAANEVKFHREVLETCLVDSPVDESQIQNTLTYIPSGNGVLRLQGASYQHHWQEKSKILILAVSEDSVLYEKIVTRVFWDSQKFSQRFHPDSYSLLENQFSVQKEALLKSLNTFLAGRLRAQCKD